MLQQKRYYQVSLMQLTVLAAIVGLASVFSSWAVGLPILLGGLVAVLANVWFAIRLFASGTIITSSTKLVARANRGVIEKYFFSTLGFICIFVLFQPKNAVWVFLSYILMLCLQFVGFYYVSRDTQPGREKF